MSDTQNTGTPKRSMFFSILWFGAILVLGVALPIYFTVTQSGTAALLIQAQVWIYQKLIHEAKWHPVATGLVTAVIHIFALLGIVAGVSLLVGLFRKKKA